MYIIDLKDISQKDIKIAGGKGAALGEMLRNEIPIPQGFILTTSAYYDYHNKPLSKNFVEEVKKYISRLGATRVAVRSSAIAEDSKQASWAGQLESYLNVTEKDLFEKINKCWASIHSERALVYIKHNQIPSKQLAIAVVIQKMIDSEISGVMFTKNPVTNNNNEIMIEAGYGLGELLVQGEITPDNYVVDKKNLQIKEHFRGNQQKMLTFIGGRNQVIPLPDEQKNEQTLTQAKIDKVSRLGIIIEKHFKAPQDIEWAIEKEKIYILQSRPITS